MSFFSHTFVSLQIRLAREVETFIDHPLTFKPRTIICLIPKRIPISHMHKYAHSWFWKQVGCHYLIMFRLIWDVSPKRHAWTPLVECFHRNVKSIDAIQHNKYLMSILHYVQIMYVPWASGISPPSHIYINMQSQPSSLLWW